MDLSSRLKNAFWYHARSIVSGVNGIRGAIAKRVAKKATLVVQARLVGIDKSISWPLSVDLTAMAPPQNLRHVVVMIANGCHGATGVLAILLVVTLHKGIGLARIQQGGLVACFAMGPQMRQEFAKVATPVTKTVFGMTGKSGGLVHKPVASI